MRDDVAVEVDVYFCGAEDDGVYHAGEIAFAVEVVTGKRRGRHVARVPGHGLDRVQIEGLSVEDVLGEAFFEEFDKMLGGAATDEAGLDVGLAHHLAEIVDEGERDAAGSGLEREAVAHDT